MTTTVIEKTLQHLTLGEPQGFQNLAMFPLLAEAEAKADYLTLPEALAGGHVRITGVSEAGRVPELLLDNPSPHDVSGLLAGRLHDADLTIVVGNDDGGGIFEYLPVAQAIPRSVFEPLFAVPHGLDLSELVRGLWWNAVRVRTAAEFKEALSQALRGGRHVIEVPVDRALNTAFHGTLSDAVRSQLRRERPR